MTRLFATAGAACLLLAGVAAAQAESATAKKFDAGPVIENSDAMAAADQPKPMNMRQQIQDQLGKDGYTDISVMPSSFYVKAKDKMGNPVAMVIGPDSFTEIMNVKPKAAQ